MTEHRGQAVVALEAMGAAIDARDWEALRATLAPEVSVRYEHTGERFGRDSFVALNAEYPGRWHFTWVELIDGGQHAVGRARVEGGSATYYVASFVTTDDSGLITELTEVWTDEVPETPPART